MGGFGMNEDVARTIGAYLRLIRDQIGPGLSQLLHRTDDVIHDETDVMQSLTPFLQEASDPSLIAQRLNQLDPTLGEGKGGNLNTFLRDVTTFDDVQPQCIPVESEGFIKIAHDDSNVVDG
jgi:hypothetical protein